MIFDDEFYGASKQEVKDWNQTYLIIFPAESVEIVLKYNKKRWSLKIIGIFPLLVS